MKPEDKLLYICVRQELSQSHQEAFLALCDSTEIDWEIVLRKALLHSVAPLVYHNLLQNASMQQIVAPEVMEQLELCYYRNIVLKERAASKLADIASFFNSVSSDVMLIKGAALDALVYEQPWYTMSNDVDLVIREKHEEITDTKIVEILKPDHKHFEWEYFEHHDVVMNGILPVNFQRIWDDAVKIQFRGRDLFVMSAEDMLISLCISDCRKRFFRLKALLDIAETVNHYGDISWGVVAQKAREYDCHNIVYATLLATKMTVGCEFPDDFLLKLEINPVRAKLMQYLMGFLCNHVPLPSSVSGFQIWGRNVNWRTILPYIPLRWYQIRRRFGYLWRTRAIPRGGIPVDTSPAIVQ
jgi:hypothetical protein